MNEIDKAALRVLVFEKTGIKIDEGDPAFAVAVIAEVLLLNATQEVHASMARMVSETISQIGDSSGPALFGELEQNIKRQLEATVAESEKVTQHFARQIDVFQRSLAGIAHLNTEQLALDIRNAAELRNNTQQVMQKAAAAMTESAQKLDQAAEQVNSGKGLRLFVLVAALGCAGIFGGFVGGYVAVNSLVHPVEQTYRR